MSWKKITKSEIILYLILAVITTGLLLWYFCVPSKGNRVEVRVAGKIVGTYDLDEDKTVLIGKTGKKNVLVIQDGKAQVTEADCPDKVCVNKGNISREGESIICLPHQVVIEIKSYENQSGEGDVDVIAK